MTRLAFSALPRASLVFAFSALLSISLEPARAAEGCSAGPKNAAPQGGHWYYRVDHASQRKCWYLAANGQKVRPGTSRLSRPLAVRTPGVVPAATEPPTVQVVAQGAAEPPRAEAVAQTSAAGVAPSALIPERSAQTESQALPPWQPSNWLVTAAEAKEDSLDSHVQPNSMDNVQDRILPDEKPAQPLVAEARIADALTRSGFGPFQFGLIVLAAMCLLAGAGLHLVGVRRRSARAAILDLNTRAPLRRPDTKVRPPSSPRAPQGLDTLEDTQAAIEARLRQFAQAWKRQAA
jgi:hypothetical protein